MLVCKDEDVLLIKSFFFFFDIISSLISSSLVSLRFLNCSSLEICSASCYLLVHFFVLPEKKGRSLLHPKLIRIFIYVVLNFLDVAFHLISSTLFFLQ